MARRYVSFIGLFMDSEGDVKAIRYQEEVEMEDDRGELHIKPMDVEAVPIERLAEVLPVAHASLIHGHDKATRRAQELARALEAVTKERDGFHAQVQDIKAELEARAADGAAPAKKPGLWARIFGS